MDSARWQQVTALFERALEATSPAEQDALLNHAARSDPSLAQEVRSLLQAHGDSDNFLDASALGDASAVLGEQLGAVRIGQKVGSWQLDALVHQGGMGSVYRASRIAGSFTQTAALKFIRLGLETPDLVRRFGRERQILATLQHPYIARLLDGGTTAEGAPWLAMEYVVGVPVDAWCDARKLGIDARIRLFCEICSAVQHAHQQLVIHRDLKPSNILVTADGTPRLLDFGIAKLLSEDGDDPELTQTRHRALTPAIASPEQFSGGTVTTATDVYALGMLLYRLLTGCAPYRVDSGTSASRLERLICYETPTRPSHAALRQNEPHATAASRASHPRRLARALRGDLDLIILKALRKEPERRYPSVAELVRDLERHLDGLPVAAQPDTIAYRTHKFAQRHWKGLLALTTAFAGLAVGLAIAVGQADAARQERDRAQQINRFLETILVEADPYASGADSTVRDVLRAASIRVGEEFANAPALEAALRQTIGYTQLGLMELDASIANLERADILNQRLYGADDGRSLRTQASLAWAAFRQGRHAEAEAGYRAVLERLGDHHEIELRATVTNDFGVILAEQERYAEAIALHRAALALWQAHQPDQARIGTVYNNLGYAYHGLEDLERAETYYRQSLELRRALHPDGLDPDLAININNLAILLRDLGRLEEALPLYRESLAIREATLGTEHAFTGFGHLNLGRVLLDLSRVDEALPHLQTALRISRGTLAEDQLQTLVARASHARALYLTGDAAAAREELAATVTLMEAVDVPSQFLEQARGWLED